MSSALAAVVIVRAAQSADTPYLVELDAVVIDESGRAVTGLRQEDFQVKEDGRPVELKTFDAVADTAAGERGVARSIVLLLDDSGIGAGNTLSIQSIARMFVSRMAAPDEFSVVRLNNRRDEAFGDRLEALMRISEYKSDALPFFGRETVENALEVFAQVSRTLEAIEQRRKAMVCIGVSGRLQHDGAEQPIQCPLALLGGRDGRDGAAPIPACTRSSRMACRDQRGR